MARLLRQPAAAIHVAAGHFGVLEHPVVTEYIGKGRYLQIAVSKAIALLYAAKFGPRTYKTLSNKAAKDGCLDLLLWTKSIGCIWDSSVFVEACKSNRINVLEQLVTDYSVRPLGITACKVGAAHGHISVLQWLRQHKFDWNEDVCSAASGAGKLETLKWLFSNGCPSNENVFSYPCYHGHFDVAQWILDQGVTASISTSVALWGDMDLMRSLHPYNAPFDGDTCAYAAYAGSLQKLQFLRAKVCQWDYRTVQCAQERGHHHIAQWALDNGCASPPDDSGGEEDEGPAWNFVY